MWFFASKSEVRDLKIRVVALERENARLISDYANMEVAVESLKSEVRYLTDALEQQQTMISDIESLKAEITALKAVDDAQASELSSIHETINNKVAEVVSAEVDDLNNSVQSTRTTLETEMAELVKATEKHFEENSKLITKLSENFEAGSEKLMGAIDKSHEITIALEGQVQSLTTDLNDSIDRQDALAIKVSTNQKRVNDLLRKVKDEGVDLEGVEKPIHLRQALKRAKALQVEPVEPQPEEAPEPVAPVEAKPKIKRAARPSVKRTTAAQAANKRDTPIAEKAKEVKATLKAKASAKADAEAEAKANEVKTKAAAKAAQKPTERKTSTPRTKTSKTK